jgi:hypothetical protein
MSPHNQFTLLHERRFLPYFLTQFLGAFNDNVYKNALIILITYQAGNLAASQTNLLTNLSAALFIYSPPPLDNWRINTKNPSSFG